MTDETKPTPGPWHVDKDGWVVSEAEDFAICLIDGSRQLDEFDPIDRANATLIIASPDMLDVLKACQLLLGDLEAQLQTRFGTLVVVDAVIAKAEGRSK